MGEVEKMKPYKFAVIFILIFLNSTIAFSLSAGGVFPSWIDGNLIVFLIIIFDVLLIAEIF